MNTPSFSSHSGRATSSELNSRVKTFALPDKCFEKRIACTWRRGNQFTIYPRSQTTSKTPAEIPENKVLKIRQEILLFSPILRKLVNESNGTFLSLQKAAESTQTTDNQVEYLKLSRQYRSIIRVCIESLQDAAAKEKDGVEKNNLLSCITIFYSIECIWHLCEFLYIDNIPGDIVLPYLLEWVRFHFPCHEQTAAQLLEACERGSEDHPEYWDTVIGMVVQGRVDVARALMKLHSSSESNEFKLVDNSLRTMPIYSVYGGISTGEFTISWKHWQAECRSKLTSRVLASHPQLELIMRLIIGEYAAFESLHSRYTSWFDTLGGWVMFACPAARRHELRAAAAACAAAAARPARTHLDVMVRALIDGDLHQVIHEIQQVSDNGWFATHLTDILFHCGKLKILDKHQANVTHLLRESLILEYGSLLFEHKSLWTVGLSYLTSCTAGARRGELLLERLPAPTEARALRVVAEARGRGLLAAAQTVCACMSARHLSAGRIGAAIAWGARAHSPALCSRAAHQALQHYRATGELVASDVLLTVGAETQRSALPLLLLSKYCDFHRLYKNREFKKAGKLLVSLITSKLCPDYFWDTLLLDTLPLLECDEIVFSSEDTCAIMSCLELRPNSLAGEKADLLRLALARNLARAALAPGDSDPQ